MIQKNEQISKLRNEIKQIELSKQSYPQLIALMQQLTNLSIKAQGDKYLCSLVSEFEASKSIKFTLEQLETEAMAEGSQIEEPHYACVIKHSDFDITLLGELKIDQEFYFGESQLGVFFMNLTDALNDSSGGLGEIEGDGVMSSSSEGGEDEDNEDDDKSLI